MKGAGVRAIMVAIQAGGGEARIVGGAVRDALLGKEVHDIDMAVNLPPEIVTGLLTQAGIKVVPTGIAHGTITAVYDRVGYEITTLRHDIETDGRRAKVAFTDDWQADAARRDFTFNALYLDGQGRLYDYFEGRADLAARLVRFIGTPKERICEDFLRLLRVFRFYAQIGDETHPANIEPQSLKACCDFAALLPALSVERVWREFSRLLATHDPCPALRLMQEGGVLSILLPEAGPLDRVQALVKIEKGRAIPCAIRRLAALLQGDAVALAQRLRLSKAEAARLKFLLELGDDWASLQDAKALRQKLYDYGTDAVRDALLLVAASVAEAQDFPLDDRLGLTRNWRKPVFPLTGKDLGKLGITAGPEMGKLLATVERWWRENDFMPDKAACIVKLKEGL